MLDHPHAGTGAATKADPPAHVDPLTIDLRDGWQLAATGASRDAPPPPDAGPDASASMEPSLDVRLPADVHGVLRDAGRIADPYVGLNEDAARGVSERGWTLSRTFTLEAVPPRATLRLDRVDCHAELRVNGAHVLSPRNAFHPWTADVAEHLREGANTIEIDLLSPVEEGARLQAEQPYRVPHLAKICPIPNGNMLRKPQCDFGWDWAPALAPMGVYGTVALTGPQGWIEPPVIAQSHAKGRVEVRVAGTVAGRAPLGREDGGDGKGREDGGERVEAVLLAPDGTRAAEAVGALDAAGRYALALDVADPALWWPNGSGAQPLGILRMVAMLSALGDVPAGWFHGAFAAVAALLALTALAAPAGGSR